MAKVITPAVYKDLKAISRSTEHIATAATRAQVSTSTMRRVAKSKNYLEFKELLKKDRGSGYAERRASSKTTPQPTPQPQRKWWEKLLNI